MHLFFRTIFHLRRSRRRAALQVQDVSRVRLRVLPTDLDVLGHMNNGVYLSIMDLGRMDLMVRTGMWAKLRAAGYYPVMANATSSYRKSLQPWQRFTLETRLVGVDAKAVYAEQRFVVDGEIYAQGTTRARFLKRGGATVSVTELADITGIDVTTMPPPAWVEGWVSNVALPPTRAEAPSAWD